MRFSAVAAALASISAVAAQQRITVTVGVNNGLTYEPATVTAAEGDTIAFRFVSKNHTVTQSSFDQPCVARADGIDSGYVPVAQDATEFPEWSITINNASAPMWFYCAQGAHCQAGMVFSVNPTAERTHEAFVANAQGGSAPAPSGSGSGLSASGSLSPSATDSDTSGSPSPSANDAEGTGAPSGGDNNGAMSLSGSKATALALVGLAAGLLL
ncbi:hypothetical protein AX16_007939 [Volvariella volvacea WC 439]|nr:hypothetical protein AX16_007939 [Volvariella volvacea WC 439]